MWLDEKPLRKESSLNTPLTDEICNIIADSRNFELVKQEWTTELNLYLDRLKIREISESLNIKTPLDEPTIVTDNGIYIFAGDR